MTTSNFSAGRDVAIVGFAQTKHVRAADTLSEVELIQPVIAEVMEKAASIRGVKITKQPKFLRHFTCECDWA